MALELATIPPHLCGWWSVEGRGSHAARLIRRIIGDEMHHMGVVCILLVALGGRPRITEAALAYPGPLPGGMRGGVNVCLSGLTRPFVHDVMMAIEAPRGSPRPRPEQLARHRPRLRRPAGRLQVHGTRTLGPRAVGRAHRFRRSGTRGRPRRRRARDRDHQGAGRRHHQFFPPEDAFGDDYPAHYYAFGEMYHGRQLREEDDGWEFAGAPVPFPEARPMARVPAGPTRRSASKTSSETARLPPRRMRGLLEATDRLDGGDAQPAAGEREELLERVRAFERAARQRVADLRTQPARAEEFAATPADRLTSGTAP